jgi:hypothetical protein
MFKKCLLRIILVIFSFTVTIIFAESIAHLSANLLGFPEALNKEIYLKKVEFSLKNINIKIDQKKLNIPLWVSSEQVQQPFTGYMPQLNDEKLCGPGFANFMCMSNSRVKINDLGLYTSMFDKRKKENQLRVAITGGSVANLFVQSSNEEIIRLIKLDKRFKDKEIEIINLALPGYKYPQQVNLIVWLHSLGYEFDVVIDISGLNEVYLSRHYNMVHNTGYAYPFNIFWHASPFPMDSSSVVINDIRLNFLDFIGQNHEIINDSSFLRLAKLILINSTENRIKSDLLSDFKNQELNAFDLYKSGSAINKLCQSDKCYLERAELWTRGIETLFALSNSYNFRFYSILQPNHYMTDPINLNLSDQKIISEDFGWNSTDSLSWEVMRLHVKKLKKDGYRIKDFSDPYIFSKLKTASLVDGCCHLTKEGYKKLTEDVAKFFLDKY